MVFQPKVTHIKNPQDLTLLPRLVGNFSRLVSDTAVEDINQLADWRKPEKLLEMRKELLRLVKEATLERKDEVTESLKQGKIDRRAKPYLRMALLCVLISWHLDQQMREIEGFFSS